MGVGVFMYLLLLGAVAVMHSIYFGQPLSELWFKPLAPPKSQAELQSALETSAEAASPSIIEETDLYSSALSVQEWVFEHLSISAVELDVALGVTLAALFIGLSKWMSGRFQWARQLDEEFSVFFQETSSVSITLLAIGSALSEEIVFRGWLQNHLGLVCTSVIFGLLHIPPKRSQWPWTVSALLMGFVFGMLYEWRGAVTAPFIAHFTINFFNIHSLAQRDSMSSKTREESS